jgi:hypothetical protein
MSHYPTCKPCPAHPSDAWVLIREGWTPSGVTRKAYCRTCNRELETDPPRDIQVSENYRHFEELGPEDKKKK